MKQFQLAYKLKDSIQLPIFFFIHFSQKPSLKFSYFIPFHPNIFHNFSEQLSLTKVINSSIPLLFPRRANCFLSSVNLTTLFSPFLRLVHRERTPLSVARPLGPCSKYSANAVAGPRPSIFEENNSEESGEKGRAKR